MQKYGVISNAKDRTNCLKIRLPSLFNINKRHIISLSNLVWRLKETGGEFKTHLSVISYAFRKHGNNNIFGKRDK